MTRVTPGCRMVAALGLLISPLLATAERPVISSCSASPSIVAPGGTAKIYVKATSPSGLEIHYIFTSTAGTVVGDGASATFTAGATTTGIVTVMCEARDTHDSWVRSRTWIKVAGAATAGTVSAQPAPAQPVPAKPAPAKPQSAAAGVTPGAGKVPQVTQAQPPPAVTHAKQPPPVVVPAHPAPAPAVTRAATPPSEPAQPRPSTTPPQVATQPAAAPAQSVVPPPTPQVTPVPSPAVTPSATPKSSPDAAQPSADDTAEMQGVKQSKDGLIEYDVPQKMIVGVASKVTVKIHGYSIATETTRAGSLTAQYMKVLLLAEDPSGLKIVSQGRADVQYVPKNKTATWVWIVTPMGVTSHQKLQVRVFDEYKTNAEQDIAEESYSLQVTAPSRLALAKDAYFNDQDAWWKYWLPSGVVCLVLIWLFLRLLDPRKRTPEGTAQNFEASDWL